MKEPALEATLPSVILRRFEGLSKRPLERDFPLHRAKRKL